MGCGYTGLRLARRWLAQGYRVRGHATREERLAEIAASGAEPCRLDLDALEGTGDVVAPQLDFEGHTVYYAVPPAATSLRDERLERFLGRLTGRPARIIYLSTTGVYGDQGGDTVDEDTPPAPRTDRARRRVAAECALQDWGGASSNSWCILRIPGIYGPGRLPLDRLRRGDPVIELAESTPANRIHVDDLVTACHAAGASERAHRRIFNVTDGNEESLTAYLLRVARIAGLPAPPQIDRARARQVFSTQTWSFLGESRRVDNKRMLAELGVILAYRDLDAGIRASL